MANEPKINNLPFIKDVNQLKGLPEGQVVRGPDNQLYQLVGDIQLKLNGILPQAAQERERMANIAALGEDPTRIDPAKVPFPVLAQTLGYRLVPFAVAGKNKKTLLDYIRSK